MPFNLQFYVLSPPVPLFFICYAVPLVITELSTVNIASILIPLHKITCFYLVLFFFFVTLECVCLLLSSCQLSAIAAVRSLWWLILPFSVMDIIESSSARKTVRNLTSPASAKQCKKQALLTPPQWFSPCIGSAAAMMSSGKGSSATVDLEIIEETDPTTPSQNSPSPLDCSEDLLNESQPDDSQAWESQVPSSVSPRIQTRKVHFCWHFWFTGKFQNFWLFAILYLLEWLVRFSNWIQNKMWQQSVIKALAKCQCTSRSPEKWPSVTRKQQLEELLAHAEIAWNDNINTPGKIDNIHMK